MSADTTATPPSSTTASRLLDAVDVVISEHGPSGVTLRRVGTQAGLSHTAAAHYFGDKPGLFTAYITRAFRTVADGIEAVATEPDPRSALVAAAVSYAEFAQSHPAAFSVMNRLELVRVDTAELWQERERGFFALAGLIDRYQATGWSAERETLDVIAMTWSMVQGFVDLWVGGPLQAPYDGQDLLVTLQRVVNDLLDSLA